MSRTRPLARLSFDSLRIVRCRVQPAWLDRPPAVHWSITGASPRDFHLEHAEDADHAAVPDDEAPDLVVIGEFYSHGEEALAMVTSELQVRYSDGEPPSSISDPEGFLAELEKVGALANHLLYDTAASFARQLLATTGLVVDVPEETPEPQFFLLDDAADDDDLHSEEGEPPTAPAE